MSSDLPKHKSVHELVESISPPHQYEMPPPGGRGRGGKFSKPTRGGQSPNHFLGLFQTPML